jgi:hypothetical protein
VDYFEMTVYLGIVGIASVSVLSAVWLMVRSMVPKRRKGQTRRQLAQVRQVKEVSEGRRPAQIEAPSESKKSKKNKKKDKNKNDKLLKLNDYPESRLLAEGNESGEKTKKNKGKQVKEPEPAPVMMDLEAAADRANTDEGEAVVPDLNSGEMESLPSLDTLVEGTDEPEAQLDTDALMSVFDVGEEVDTDTADLAATLFDVDVQNIGDLTSEITSILAEMKPK